jgi:hypothetical protein
LKKKWSANWRTFGARSRTLNGETASASADYYPASEASR